jgi:hypothetical protein
MGKDKSNPFMVVMTYQKSYSNQHTMIHVQSVELVISSPWIIPFLGTKGLTNPEWMATGKDTSKPFKFSMIHLSQKLTHLEVMRIVWNLKD